MRKTNNHILSESTRIIADKIIDKSDDVQVNAVLMHAALMEAADRIEELDIALHDAINRPKGIVPKSGEEFYSADKCYE